jgi:hypothetical protein
VLYVKDDQKNRETNTLHSAQNIVDLCIVQHPSPEHLELPQSPLSVRPILSLKLGVKECELGHRLRVVPMSLRTKLKAAVDVGAATQET